MVRFSASPKNEPHSPLARAKRARDAKNAFRLCPSLSYTLYRNACVIASQEKRFFCATTPSSNASSCFFS
ncbi:MAG: hypothetical protein U5L45_18355 [Saprospiraceae bacterium]|nr:hypothetical protein [Saprospiraceae bacterium]